MDEVVCGGAMVYISRLPSNTIHKKEPFYYTILTRPSVTDELGEKKATKATKCNGSSQIRPHFILWKASVLSSTCFIDQERKNETVLKDDQRLSDLQRVQKAAAGLLTGFNRRPQCLDFTLLTPSLF